MTVSVCIEVIKPFCCTFCSTHTENQLIAFCSSLSATVIVSRVSAYRTNCIMCTSPHKTISHFVVLLSYFVPFRSYRFYYCPLLDSKHTMIFSCVHSFPSLEREKAPGAMPGADSHLGCILTPIMSTLWGRLILFVLKKIKKRVPILAREHFFPLGRNQFNEF